MQPTTFRSDGVQIDSFWATSSSSDADDGLDINLMIAFKGVGATVVVLSFVLKIQTIYEMWAGILVEWLREETHAQKVVGSNPWTLYCMVIFSHTCLL